MHYHSYKPFALFIACSFSAVLYADVNGADPKLTAAPGDDSAACTRCHTGTSLNGGSGSVKIILPGSGTYTPGVKQRIQIQVSDPSQRRWGFELTARVARNPSSEQAGDLESVDSNAKVVCANGRSKPCTAGNTIQYATHTQTGTRLGTSGGVTFEVDWTPPDSDVGVITFYAAGNAANGNNSDSGDRIYTTKLDVQPAALTVRPSPANTDVVNAASLQTTIAPNTWLKITGTNLATTTRSVSSEELASGVLPTSMDNVSVTINGKAAFLGYVSPTRLEVLAGNDDSVGPVQVVVKLNDQSSDAVISTVQSVSPGLFTADGKRLLATTADATAPDLNTLLLGDAKYAFTAQPGDTILLFGTGFGLTDPVLPAGQLISDSANLVAPVSVTVGSQPASVLAAAVVPGVPGVFQFKVQLPVEIEDGDQALTMTLDGTPLSTAKDCCTVTIKKQTQAETAPVE